MRAHGTGGRNQNIFVYFLNSEALHPRLVQAFGLHGQAGSSRPLLSSKPERILKGSGLRRAGLEEPGLLPSRPTIKMEDPRQPTAPTALAASTPDSRKARKTLRACKARSCESCFACESRTATLCNGGLRVSIMEIQPLAPLKRHESQSKAQGAFQATAKAPAWSCHGPVSENPTRVVGMVRNQAVLNLAVHRCVHCICAACHCSCAGSSSSGLTGSFEGCFVARHEA